MALSQPIFQVRGTQIKPYFSQGLSSYSTFRNSSNTDAALLTLGTTGVFGGSVIDFSAASGNRALQYPGYKNWPSVKTISLLFRIVPLWTGTPASQQSLIWAGQAVQSYSCSGTINITTAGKLFIDFGDRFGLDIFGTSANALTFTNGTPTTIIVTWDGANTAKIYQDNALIETLTLSGSFTGTWDQNQISMITLGYSLLNGSSPKQNYYLNELCIWDSVVDGTQASTTSFETSSNLNGDTLADPSTVKIGVVNGFQTGTYDGSDRWTDPGVSNVAVGVSYLANAVTKNGAMDEPVASDVKHGVIYFNGTRTGTYRGADLWTDPGISNVLSGVPYNADGVGKVGTYSSASSDPGVANVKTGTNYTINGAFKTGTYDGSDRWSDPGPTNVAAGIAYRANNIDRIGTRGTVINSMAQASLLAQSPFGIQTQQLSITQGDAVVFNFMASTGSGGFDLTGAVFESYFEGVNGKIIIGDSQHLKDPDQIGNKGKFTLQLLDSDSANLKTGWNMEVITKVTQGSTVEYFHGRGILQVLSPIPGK
jgi:hypothetical protein